MEFDATIRDISGTSASRRMRRSGFIPAIIYGKKINPIDIKLDHNEIYHFLLKEKPDSNPIVQLKINKGKNNFRVERALIREVQWHPYKPQVLHVDFQRVNEK